MPAISYQRSLPHIHPNGYPLFITFRLANSLPIEALRKLKNERELASKSAPSHSRSKISEFENKSFDCYDDWLSRCQTGPRWLEDEKIANILIHKIHEMNNERYNLIAYCIMPNHVHMLIEHILNISFYHRGKSAKYPVTETLRLLKGITARDCNLALNRSGQFWHHESYDHFVRDKAELERTIKYILNNPVKAGLVKEWTDWKFAYVNPEFGKW